MIPTIKLKRFVLRPFRKGDEVSLQKNINDKAIYRYTARIPHPYTLEDAKRWVASKNTRTKINFVIDIGGEVAGGIGYDKIDGRVGRIGFWLAKKHWNKGIMTEAVKYITEYGFIRLRLERIRAGVFMANKASIKVLEKAGYKREGKLPRLTIKDGNPRLSLWYIRIKN